MTSDELIGFVENKFEKHGVKKVVPDDETLQLHARRMLERQMVLQELDTLLPGIRERVAETALPDDLRAQVEKWLEEHPRLPWDAAVADILSTTWTSPTTATRRNRGIRPTNGPRRNHPRDRRRCPTITNRQRRSSGGSRRGRISMIRHAPS